jgi:hypothetical protein
VKLDVERAAGVNAPVLAEEAAGERTLEHAQRLGLMCRN